MGGEVLHVTERLVLSPVTGRFVVDGGSPAGPPTVGEVLLAGAAVGEVVGSGAATPVTTSFTGVLAGLLALEGERVREGQPIAWMRVA